MQQQFSEACRCTVAVQRGRVHTVSRWLGGAYLRRTTAQSALSPTPRAPHRAQHALPTSTAGASGHPATRDAELCKRWQLCVWLFGEIVSRCADTTKGANASDRPCDLSFVGGHHRLLERGERWTIARAEISDEPPAHPSQYNSVAETHNTAIRSLSKAEQQRPSFHDSMSLCGLSRQVGLLEMIHRVCVYYSVSHPTASTDSSPRLRRSHAIVCLPLGRLSC